MTTPRQLTQITMAGGIDERLRGEAIEPGSAFRTLENVREYERGTKGKRYGFAAGTLLRFDGSSRAAGYKLFSDDKSIVVIDGSVADALDTSAGKWTTGITPCELGYTLSDLPSLGPATTVADLEYCNGHIACATVGADGAAYVTIIDAASLTIVKGPTSLQASVSQVLLGSYSSRYLVAVVGSSAAEIKIYTLDTQAIGTGWSAGTTIVSAGNWGTGLAVHSLSDRVAVAYGLSSGVNRVAVQTCTVAGSVDSTTIATASTSPTTLALAGSIADTLWVGWTLSTNVNLVGLTGNNLAVVKATQLTGLMSLSSSPQAYGLRIAASATTGQGRIMCGCGTETMFRGFKTAAGATATNGAQVTLQSTFPLGRPYVYAGRYYSAFYSQGALGGTLNSNSGVAVCEWTADLAYLRPVAALFPSLVTYAANTCKMVTASAATQALYALTITRSAAATTAELVTLDFADARRWQAVKHGSSTFLTGACATIYDGARTTEIGFLAKPTLPATTTSGTGITLANGRRYVAVYEDVDSDGNWVVSGISDPCASTGAVTNKTISVSTCPLTMSARAPSASTRVVFYATLDANANQPPYYRVGDVANDTTVSAVTFGDAVPEATLATRPKLYAPNLPSTPGDSLDRRGPAGMMALVSYNGMLVGTDGRNIYWSGQPVDGEATWFSPLFQLPLPGCLALSAQDGILYAYTRRAVYAIAGEQPADNGTSGGLGTPRRLAVDVGCIEPRSLVVTSKGTFFQSERGIELLTRAEDVVWVGEKVRKTLAAFPIITAATLDASLNLVYFELAATETANQVSGGGRTLVFDLTLVGDVDPIGTWISTDRRKDNVGNADAAAQSACLVWTGSAYRYAWLGTDGRVYTEDRTTYLDPGSAWVTQRAEWPWFKNGGLQGYQEIELARFFLKSATAHDLNVYVGYDYASSYKSAQLYTASALSALNAVLPNEQIEHPLHDDNECQGITFKLEDVIPSTGTVGTGQGATWLGLSIQGTAREGLFPLPDNVCR